MKKALLTIFVVLIVFLLSACFSLSDNSRTKWFDSKSENGMNTIEVIKVGETFTFGAQNLSINANGSEIYSTELANDGGALHDDNYSVNWIDNNVVILIFKGNEQEDEKIKITFSDSGAEHEIIVDDSSNNSNSNPADVLYRQGFFVYWATFSQCTL